MEQNGKTLTYFQQHAYQFDRLYRQEDLLLRWFNHLVRRPFYRRYELTIAACGDVREKRILDVGCGSGRYTVALAQRGADVTGIDFASNMLFLAQDLAKKSGVMDRCHFVQADFLEYSFSERFNIALAIGFFDYIADPATLLEKLRLLTMEKVIITFPHLGGWRAFQRRLRYRLRGYPIYFHSQDSMANHFTAAGYRDWQFVGSWAVAFPTEPGDALPLET